MEEQCNKENEVLDRCEMITRTPGNDRTRSPGPKVAKLLEVFSGADKANENTPLQGSKFNEGPSSIKNFRTKEDKLKSARAARLNASYVEANKVINQLLETTTGNDCHTGINELKTPEELPVILSNEPPVSNSVNEMKEGGFDVQKFLSTYCSKASSQIVKEIPATTESESPKPTAAVSFILMCRERMAFHQLPLNSERMSRIYFVLARLLALSVSKN